KPVIVSTAARNGHCDSCMGSFIILNDEGWILTAHHIIEEIDNVRTMIADLAAGLVEAENKRTEIEVDEALNNYDRRKKLEALPKADANSLCDYSVWWGGDGIKLVDVTSLPNIDLTLGRLEPFNSG